MSKISYSAFTLQPWPDGVIKMRWSDIKLVYTLANSKLPWLKKQRGYTETSLSDGCVILHVAERYRYILTVEEYR